MKHPLLPTLVVSLALTTATLSGAALAQSSTTGAADSSTARTEQTDASAYDVRTAGSVIKADKESGIYKITTRDGNFTLHFPPSVQDLSRWDKVILHVTMVPGSGDSTSPRLADFQGVHTMQGTIAKVKPKKNEVRVETDAGKLKLIFPKQSVDQLEKKDMVSVTYGYKKSD